MANGFPVWSMGQMQRRTAANQMPRQTAGQTYSTNSTSSTHSPNSIGSTVPTASADPAPPAYTAPPPPPEPPKSEPPERSAGKSAPLPFLPEGLRLDRDTLLLLALAYLLWQEKADKRLILALVYIFM